MIWALRKTEISIQRRRKKIRTFLGSESRIESPHPEPMGPLSSLLTGKHILSSNVTIPGGPAVHGRGFTTPCLSLCLMTLKFCGIRFRLHAGGHCVPEDENHS